MTARTTMQLVKACENVLGWTPNPSMPLSTARTVAARRLGKEMAKDPEKFSLHNLELAIELCRRQRQPIKSPLYLIHKVDEAVAAANVPASAVRHLERHRAGHRLRDGQRPLRGARTLARPARAGTRPVP